MTTDNYPCSGHELDESHFYSTIYSFCQLIRDYGVDDVLDHLCKHHQTFYEVIHENMNENS